MYALKVQPVFRNEKKLSHISTSKLTPVARGRTRRPLAQRKLIESRTHTRGRSQDNKAQRRARARGENTHKPQGRARARGAYSQMGKQWRVRACVANI